jgi:hypothetical protein
VGDARCIRCDHPIADPATISPEAKNHNLGCPCPLCAPWCFGASDCLARAVNWRAETLRLRAEVAAMRPVVEAADAFTPLNRFRIDTYPKSAPVRLYEAVEEYRTTDAYIALPKEPA